MTTIEGLRLRLHLKDKDENKKPDYNRLYDPFLGSDRKITRTECKEVTFTLREKPVNHMNAFIKCVSSSVVSAGKNNCIGHMVLSNDMG